VRPLSRQATETTNGVAELEAAFSPLLTERSGTATGSAVRSAQSGYASRSPA